VDEGEDSGQEKQGKASVNSTLNPDEYRNPELWLYKGNSELLT
jgi:hypothetical protein